MSTARQTLAIGGSKQRSLRFDRRFDRHVDFRFGDVEFFGSLRLRTRALRAPNGSHAKLCGQGPRAEAGAARRLPRMTFEEPRGECNRRDAVTLAKT
jgi:hypothetical protein